MIKVERTSCPDILKYGENPNSLGELETKDAILFYSTINNHLNNYKKTGKRGVRTKESYSVYSEKIIRTSLRQFHFGKCAYCESKIDAIYGGDVEHFRPKAGYGSSNHLIKPGYFWLASDWNNLLFACPFCNQTNTHEIKENGVIEEVVLGKLNQFPLKTETYRLNYTHGLMFLADPLNYEIAYELEETERLVLKPCTDNVEKYFKYEEDGRILPADGLDPLDTERANTSIHVYALKRISLIQSREERVIQIKAQIRRVEEAMINLNNHITESNAVVTWFEGILRKELNILHKYKEPNMEYAGLARFLIDKYFDQLL